MKVKRHETGNVKTAKKSVKKSGIWASENFLETMKPDTNKNDC